MVNHPLYSGLNKVKELERIISGFDISKENLTAIDRDLILEKIRGIYSDILSIEINEFKLNPLVDSLNDKETELTTNIRKIDNKDNSVVNYSNENHSTISAIKNPEKNKPSDHFGKSSKNHKNETLDINEKLSKKISNRTLIDNHKMSPIKDLNEAIEINKKFSFLNELFKGDMQEYLQAINHLNNFENLIEAEDFLQNKLEKKYDWKNDQKKELLNDLMGFLQRRYLSNRAS